MNSRPPEHLFDSDISASEGITKCEAAAQSNRFFWPILERGVAGIQKSERCKQMAVKHDPHHCINNHARHRHQIKKGA
jgi:hypothetical protein